jgi:hypothetical protein
VKRDRAIAPSHRQGRVSNKPSRGESEQPVGDYRTKTTDHLGRSATFTVTTRPQVRRIASKIVQRELFPFDTEQDVLRWCIDHGIEELARRAKDKEITSEFRQMNNLIRTAQHELEQDYYQKNLDVMEATCMKLLKDNHPSRAERLAELIWKNCDSIPDPYWRKYYRERSRRIMRRVAERIEAEND